jgi:hypothetical protein
MSTRSTSDVQIDRTIEAWLELGPTELSGRVVDAARAEIHRTRQQGSWWAAWRLPSRRLIRAVASFALAAVVIAMIGVGLRVASTPAVGNYPSPSPTPSATPVSSPAASAATVGVLPDGGQPVFSGTYSTRFQPALTLTVDRVVDLDCSPGYLCRGTVDVNAAGWLDLEFGNVHGSEIDIIRLDKVYDPKSPKKLIDPPKDLAAWIRALPGTAVLQSPKAVVIGGLPGTQFDVRTPGNLQFRLIPGGYGQAGIGPSGLRVILLTVHGHLVLISEWLGADNTVRDGQAALDSLQPLVDSIKWL